MSVYGCVLHHYTLGGAYAKRREIPQCLGSGGYCKVSGMLRLLYRHRYNGYLRAKRLYDRLQLRHIKYRHSVYCSADYCGIYVKAGNYVKTVAGKTRICNERPAERTYPDNNRMVVAVEAEV